MFTTGGGFVLVTKLEGVITGPEYQRLARLTVTGVDGRTTYVYLDAEEAERLCAEVVAAAGVPA